jgi:uncharacterized protein YukE
MPQAIVDPDELRRFAAALRKFNGDMRDRLTSLGSQMAGLTKTWRDQEQKKFTEEFEQHLKVISRFMDLTEQHIPYLLRKAEAIDQYLQSR